MSPPTGVKWEQQPSLLNVLRITILGLQIQGKWINAVGNCSWKYMILLPITFLPVLVPSCCILAFTPILFLGPVGFLSAGLTRNTVEYHPATKLSLFSVFTSGLNLFTEGSGKLCSCHLVHSDNVHLGLEDKRWEFFSTWQQWDVNFGPFGAMLCGWSMLVWDDQIVEVIWLNKDVLTGEKVTRWW